MTEKLYKNISEKDRADKVVDILNAEFRKELPEKGEPFVTLVRTILSQNTNSKNTSKAFENLKDDFEKPEDFLEADLEELKERIKPAGLYNSKSKTLKNVSRIIHEDFEKDLKNILKGDPEKARKFLLELPGVGPKTADCVLLFSCGYDVLPVDTHVDRTSKRLGFVDIESNKEEVKNRLECLLSEGYRGTAHILLIELGRKYCKARNPDCEECPVNNYCPKKGIES